MLEIDFANIRNEFPLLQTTNRGKRIVFLDSAASAQKPQSVINALANFYTNDYANIHRGIYELSARATALYEKTRATVKEFINARSKEEIIFVSGTTAGINLIAQSYGRSQLRAGDEVILSVMEHHSNIVPWTLLQEQLGIVLKIIPLTNEGALDLTAYQNLFSTRTKLVTVAHASNALGVINPIAQMAQIAHAHDVPILVDGAQGAPHLPVDVQALDCDFYVFSGHKLYGPTGVGVVYGKKSWLDKMPPYQGGGDMIETVSFNKVTYAPTPQKFEAGTPHIAGVIGLEKAIQYLQQIGMQQVMAHEQALLASAETKLLSVPGLKIIGNAKPKVGVISFVIEGIHPHDLGTVLDHEGIAVRAGHHCAMPLMEYFQIPTTVRVSFGIYNTEKDIEDLLAGIQLAQRLFA